MTFDRTGIILLTENYAECVAFYKDKLMLPVMFATESLTCFEFGGAYLMVETNGRANPQGKTVEQSPVTLRMNVADVDDAVERLREKGIEAWKEVFEWGVIANFYDPEGNVCQLKDSKTFEERLREVQAA